MFGVTEENNLTENEIMELAKLGEKMIADLNKLKAAGKMTVEQELLYNEILKIYNET